MSKAKHEALRRDIDDYKNLLIKYQSLRIEYETLISDLDRQSKLLESKVDALEEGRKRIKYLDDEIETLRIIIQKQSKKITDAENSNRVLRKLYETESAKAYSMKKGQAEVYIWRYTTIFFFCMMLIVGTQGS
jgi:exonuclease VII small subunit